MPEKPYPLVAASAENQAYNAWLANLLTTAEQEAGAGAETRLGMLLFTIEKKLEDQRRDAQVALERLLDDAEERHIEPIVLAYVVALALHELIVDFMPAAGADIRRLVTAVLDGRRDGTLMADHDKADGHA